MPKTTLAVAVAVLLTVAAAADEPNKGKAGVAVSEFGKTPDGAAVKLFTLTNANGVVAKVIELGGIVTELHVPDRDGKLDDVVLGYDNLDAYLKPHPYFGCITGRVANRIARGQFTLDGKTYTLAKNNGENHLHGGKKALDKVIWKGEEVKSADGPAVKFTYRSPDMEEGYPGNLDMAVTYTLTDKNELKIDYTATTDKATPVNLTNHSYFNLLGKKDGDVLGHELMIPASKYTPNDAALVPTGKIEPVKGTPFDFTSAKAIGKDIAQVKADPSGYDLNFVLDSGGGKLGLAGRVTEPKTGRVMEVFTTEPGIQFYTGNFLDGTLTGKGGIVYKKHAVLCLETQHFPDAVNQPNFPTTILKPGDTYKTTTVYKFSAK